MTVKFHTDRHRAIEIAMINGIIRDSGEMLLVVEVVQLLSKSQAESRMQP
jgi:hypothetical protein